MTFTTQQFQEIADRYDEISEHEISLMQLAEEITLVKWYSEVYITQEMCELQNFAYEFFERIEKLSEEDQQTVWNYCNVAGVTKDIVEDFRP